MGVRTTGASEPTSTMHLIDSTYKGNSRKTQGVFKVLVQPNENDFGSSCNGMSKYYVLLFKYSTFHEHYPSGCL